ncbi:glycosyltransferase family 2 protein [Candidatus Microgenomates bacterium]|nr:glycosyltransferase family 2 protein [Candidatus Microgenomates bacterium]
MESNNPILIISFILSGIAILRYLTYLTLSPIYEFQKIRIAKSYKNLTKRQIENRTRVSVIVPAWNEEVGIITSIKSLLKNSYRNLEIIVVNDGSTDLTNKVIREFVKKNIEGKNLNGKTFKYINKRKNAGKGAAINTGIKNSTGDLIVTMDADTKFDKDAILNVAKYFQDKTIDAGVGNVKVANSRTLIGIIQQIEYTLSFYFKRAHSICNSEYIIGGAFGIFRKEIFYKYGFFDEKNKTEDIELSTRLKSLVLKTIFIEDAIAFTEGASSFQGLMKQRLRWKKGKIDTFTKYKDLFFSNEKKHNKFLCWFLLPISVLGDFELILFPIITPVIFYYTFLIKNYEYLMGWILLVSFSIFLSYFFGSQQNNKKSAFVIPLFYLASYLLVITEIYAIVNSIKLYIQKSEITWQKWERKGVENV